MEASVAGAAVVNEDHKKLLVVAVEPQVFSRFPPLLWRQSFDVSMASNPRLGLAAVAQTQFHLILVGYPLPDFDFRCFLDEVRAFGGPCRGAPLLAVSDPIHLNEVTGFVGSGLNRAVSTVVPVLKLERVVAELLHVMPRASVRLPIDLHAVVKSAKRMVKAQVLDVSVTGMRVSDTTGLRPGMTVSFSLELPNHPWPLKGVAEVVRVSRKRAPSSSGSGLRFTTFEGDGQALLAAFIEQRLAPPAGD